jgi:enamine deaminase RidA (YjgF/YER057c/UK114 family)
MAQKQQDRPVREPIVSTGWESFFELTHVPAAVRVGDTLHVTGHTGDAPMGIYATEAEAQIRQTFANVADTLAAAGFAWSDVVELTTYHVGLSGQASALLSVAAEFLPEPYPAWTAVGVTELWDPEAIIEISCVAVARVNRAS